MPKCTTATAHTKTPQPRSVNRVFSRHHSGACDGTGIVNVSAKDKASGKQQQIRIQSSGGLSDSDIDRMVNEAEQFASADAERKAKVEAQNDVSIDQR